jgi:purine-binding chemotaxis protein CheW
MWRVGDVKLDDPAAIAEALRREFDETFRRPRALAREREEELLAIRAGESLLAVRTLETGGVLRCPPIPPLPSSFPAFLGVCGVRGALVAAYDLAALLEGSAPASQGSWMLLCGADRRVGLVFDELGGALRVAPSEIRRAAEGGGRTTLPEIVVVQGESRAVLRIPALVEEIARRSFRPGAIKE